MTPLPDIPVVFAFCRLSMTMQKMKMTSIYKNEVDVSCLQVAKQQHNSRLLLFLVTHHELTVTTKPNTYLDTIYQYVRVGDW